MRIGIVAGETSGDLLGAGLINAIKARVPDAVFEGIAGPRMIEQGCKSLFPADQLALMGLIEVIKHYRDLSRIRATLLQYFLDDPPDVFIGIDVPDFNLTLEGKLKAAGISTVHYVSPQVWAWRQYRVRKIARSVDLMLTLFPFEARFYQAQSRYKVATRFVGHPLADMIPIEAGEDMDQRTALRNKLGLPVDAQIIALLPGSRVNELRCLAARFIEAAAWCLQRRPNLYFVAPMASKATRKLFEQALMHYAPALPILILDGQSRDAITAADVVLVASGTATLETLLLKRPMVVAYRMAWLTYAIARRMLRTPYYSLPNLLAGRRVVDEISQNDVTPEKLGRALLKFLDEPDAARAVCTTFSDIHHSLRQDASTQAASAIIELVERQQTHALR